MESPEVYQTADLSTPESLLDSYVKGTRTKRKIE